MNINRLQSIVLLAAAAIGFAASSHGIAATQDDDKFEGAVWRFTMTPKKRGAEERAGLFRVHGKDLFQKDKPSDPEYKQKIGTKTAGEKGKTHFVVDGMRANRGKYTGIKGKAVVEIDKFGEWSGRFIDSEGTHWDLKLSRVQE